MAAAGMDLWKIQLFGRWGSAAILAYIRESPLETSHQWALQTAEGLELKEVEHEVRQRIVAERRQQEQLNGIPLKQAVRAAFEDRLTDAVTKVGDLSIEYQRLSEAVRKLMIKESPGEALPSLARCTHHRGRKGSIHIVENPLTALCGWWHHDNNAAELLTTRCERAAVCKKCLSKAPPSAEMAVLVGR